MSSVRRALGYSIAAQYVSLPVQFIATVIISRLLAPTEVGVFSVAAALVGIAQLLRDFGVSTYIIQEQELTEERIRAANSVVLALGWSLAIITYSIAPWAGVFYGEPGVEQVMQLAALNFALLPFSSVLNAYHRRNLDFRPGMHAAIASNLTQSSVAVGCALYGLSYMSMAWGGLAGTIVTIMVINAHRPRNFPRMPGVREIRRVLGFGGRMSGVTVLREISLVFPEAVVGKVLGFHAAGIYARADGLAHMFSRLFLAAFGSVLTPFFADAKRGGVDFAPAYYKGLSYLTIIGWPFMAALAATAPEIVPILYGNSWTEAIVPLQILCFGFAGGIAGVMITNLLQATGSINTVLQVQFISSLARVVLVLSSAKFGLTAVAWAVAVTWWLPFMLHLRDAKHAGLGGAMRHIRATYSGLLASALIVIGIFLIKSFVYSNDGEVVLTDQLTVLVIAAAVCVGLWLAYLFGTKHPITSELLSVVNRLSKRS